MADDYLDPRVNVVSSDADVERVLADDKRAGRKAPPPDAPVDWGSGGQVDRSALQAELADNPNLHARLKQMIRGEVGGSASPEVRRIQMESVMNRALVRGHSLEQGLWDTGQYGNRGYYPPQTFIRGGYHDDAYQADLASVLGGSNYGGKYLPSGHLVTGNASADVARHQFQRGTPGFTLETGSGPESYFNEDAHRAEPMARLLSGGGPMTAAIASSRPPMQEASADVTGSVPQGRRPMASPMDDAMSPGILDRVLNNIQNPEKVSDALGGMGAWLLARDNPAGGAALLAGLKKDKNAGEWSHQIDPNTGQIVSVQNKTGQVRVMPIPGYNTNKSVDDQRAKEEAKADVELDTKLGDEGRGLGARRESLNQAKDVLGNLQGGIANNEQIVKLKQLGNQMGITNFKDVPDAQVAATIANRLALEAQNQGGTRLLPGSMSDSDRKFISAMAANPTNDPEANKRILDIADKALQREEAASKVHQGMTGSGFTRKGFNAAIDNLDKQRAAELAAAQAAAPPVAPAVVGGPKLPVGVKSIQLIQ